jgi:hypothetical protein
VPRQEADRRLDYAERSFLQIVCGSWHSGVVGGEDRLADVPVYWLAAKKRKKKEAGV